LNNISRVTLQALSAVLGGTQSLHTNGYDEALSLPTEEAARIALRTQQIIAHESGAPNSVDPLAGSYFVESLTNEIEKKAWEYIERIDNMGGAVIAIEQGYMQKEIADSAYQYQRDIENKDKLIVGLNEFAMEEGHPQNLLKIDDTIRQVQIEKINKIKGERDNDLVASKLKELEQKFINNENIMPTVIEAVEAYATLGEISDIGRNLFGEYKNA